MRLRCKEHMTLNIKWAREKVSNMAKQEYKKVVMDISTNVKNAAVRKARI